MKKLFSVRIMDEKKGKEFYIYSPSSLDTPHNNSVMFVNAKNIEKIPVLNGVVDCVVYVPNGVEIPSDVYEKNFIIPCEDPRMEYCRFFATHHIENLPPQEEYDLLNGSFISKKAQISKTTIIMPGAYIGGEVKIGDNCYIGSGVRLIGKVVVGNNVVIRENTVIGADGLSTDRDENGKAVTMPQFGGVVIQDNVKVGALTVIARGAIDDTFVASGTKIDNCCFISHNVHIGEDSFIVGETIMFGGSSIGNKSFVSGNSTIRNKVSVGNGALVGMGSVVVKNVPDNTTVMGNPAKIKEK